MVTALVVTGLLCVQFARRTPANDELGGRHFSEKVNLALRRTAHHLLLASGDSTARIPPVQPIDASTFLLRLERPFNYDLVPALLQESLALHGIGTNYDVAVVDCADGSLQLGYNVQELESAAGVACGGREQGTGGHNLQITFDMPQAASAQHLAWWILAGGFLLGGMYFAWPSRKQAIPVLPAVESPASERRHFGDSSLDMANQMLLTGSIQHQLTYREGKLLHLFVSHPNQLLERSFILRAVWEDEGILVGRSVDVFVSRLRKLLREDPSLRIVAVHGVGYRLEVGVENEKGN